MLQQISVSSGCAVLAEVGFILAVAHVRIVRRNRGVDGCQSRWSSVFYRLFFLGGVSVDYGGVGPLFSY